ncbi:hypothetical protein BDZ45DRAFT_475717 [Acephala macrosclerotiorum]|nr:hypothetical protein BDZ45DRAFT_475717 [Acephala macrosclerotiorum]
MPPDEALAFQVRLQLLAQKAIRFREQQELDYAAATGSLLAFLYSKVLQTQLQDLRVAPLLVMPTSASSSDLPNFERFECLWRSVNAMKSWFDVFDMLPPSACFGMSFLFWAQFARCVVILYKPSTIEDPAWDRTAVRNTVDLLGLPLVLPRMCRIRTSRCWSLWTLEITSSLKSF